MDWSLVLVSQGIETTIEPPQEDGRWELVVTAQDCERAVKALRQYRVENRDWPWRQPLPWPQTHFDWVSILWAGLLILFYFLSSRDPNFLAAGIMDSTKVFSGQWWRVLTAMMLHADLGHLATNLSIGIVLFGLAMGQYGTGTGLLAAYLAGIGGNVASLLLNVKPFHGLGASGMVMGALGLLAAPSLLPEWRKGKSLKHVLGGAAAGVMLFVLFGLSPGTDIAAHLGGFLMGGLLGMALVHSPTSVSKNPKFNFVSGVLVVALVVATWRVALIHQ